MRLFKASPPLRSSSAWAGLFGGLALSANLATPLAAELPDYSDMSLEELGRVRIPQVYAASKYLQDASSAPASVDVVTREDILRFGHRTLSDVLRSVPGYYVTSDGGYDAVGVRGVNLLGDWGGRVLVMVDGHRLNEPYFDTTFAGTDLPVDLDLVERVEVVRGPAFSLYGNNAFLSVVNLVTRSAGGLGGWEVDGSAGGDETFAGRVSFGKQFDGGVDLRLSASVMDSAGREALYFPEYQDQLGGYATGLDHSRVQQYLASVGYGDFSLEAVLGFREKQLPTAAYQSVFGDPRLREDNERGFLEARYRREFGEGWQFSARLFFDHYRLLGEYPNPGEIAPGVAGVVVNREDVHAEYWGGEVQIDKQFFAAHRVVAGAEFHDGLRLNYLSYDQNPWFLYLDQPGDFVGAGVYLQDDYSLLTNLVLTLGGRFDYYETFGGKLHLRAGAVYDPWSGTTLKAVFGQGYRAPNLYEAQYAWDQYLPNNDLKPEGIDSAEFIWEQAVSKPVWFRASLFYMRLGDLIRQVELPGPQYQYVNSDSEEVWGGEVTVEARWSSGLRLYAGYTYSHVHESALGTLPANSPSHLGKLGASVPLYEDRLVASLELQAMGERRTRGGAELSGQGLLNFTLFSRDVLPGLALSGSLYNVLNAHYADPLGVDFLQDRLPLEGRSFRLKATYRF